MKKLVHYSVAALALLSPLTVYAHAGHVADQGWHGLLHIEHIMLLAGIAALAALLLHSRKR